MRPRHGNETVEITAEYSRGRSFPLIEIFMTSLTFPSWPLRTSREMAVTELSNRVPVCESAERELNIAQGSVPNPPLRKKACHYSPCFTSNSQDVLEGIPAVVRILRIFRVWKGCSGPIQRQAVNHHCNNSVLHSVPGGYPMAYIA